MVDRTAWVEWMESNHGVKTLQIHATCGDFWCHAFVRGPDPTGNGIFCFQYASWNCRSAYIYYILLYNMYLYMSSLIIIHRFGLSLSLSLVNLYLCIILYPKVKWHVMWSNSWFRTYFVVHMFWTSPVLDIMAPFDLINASFKILQTKILCVSARLQESSNLQQITSNHFGP